MPNTFKLSTWCVDFEGVTATRIPKDAEPYDVMSNLDEFYLLKRIMWYVDLDLAMNCQDAEKKITMSLELFRTCLANDEFTIYPIKAFNPNPKWIIRIEKEKGGK